MTEFNFRLEPVLKQREKREQEAVQARARAHKEYLRQLEKLEAIRQNLEEVMETGTVTDSFDAVNALIYREYLKAKAAQQEQKVSKASQNLEKYRRETIEAHKQKLILEKLKQNEYAKYMQKLNKIEQKINDELATQLSIRHRDNTLW